ncbi:hypothetical protein [Ruminococcus sp.]|uniref:hypothetical protein n=1 Tax=Ruminococcus sp. TaxID=41978 RepID=UPI0025F8867C|nr:hypothetical protein [Ruminococcus sp.]
MKKALTLSFAIAMTLSLCACGSEKNSTQNYESNEPAVISEKLSPAEQLLEDIEGTYDELFTVICDTKYNQVWIDKCEAFVGKDMAESTAEMLKSSCTATLYGEDAVNAYTNSEDIRFDCYFINGVKQFVFNGSNISGIDNSGKKLFEHEYKFVKDFSLGGMMEGYLYETTDNDAGEFRYFLMMPDTPATTYHTEFRYGSDLNDLAEYNKGGYAYWLAAGIPVNCGEKMIEDCISLFVEENLSETSEEEEKPAA